MVCKVSDLRHKEVINSKDGCRLGFVDDVEIDVKSATVVSLVIFGRWRCFGLLGRDEDIIIKWDCIDLIGEDTILVNHNIPQQKNRGFKGFFKK
ncbi:MAG: YlmC/YmxH family sporulation protein [Acutalibacteraceae bacterium]|nr:YlmC/YmxH family sporulation protein [Acutalibacteraceae bacterium]